MASVSNVAKELAPHAVKMAPQAAANLLKRIATVAIEGAGKLPGAVAAAEAHLAKHPGNQKAAVHALIDSHVRMAGIQGFVTGLGGLVTLPVSMPANVAGAALIQLRMVAGIAHLRGYDLDDPRVRMAIVTCLLGEKGVKTRLKQKLLPTSPLALATAPVYDPELDQQIQTEVMAELISKVGGKRIAVSVARRMPVLGGGVGAVSDGYATMQIGRYAQRLLVRRLNKPIER